MIGQAMREYGCRFLFGLIQNGYDAEPPGSESGRIAIVLACDEGAHGTLYVANTGHGFTVSNARRIRLLGLSDKPNRVGKPVPGRGLRTVHNMARTADR